MSAKTIARCTRRAVMVRVERRPWHLPRTYASTFANCSAQCVPLALGPIQACPSDGNTDGVSRRSSSYVGRTSYPTVARDQYEHNKLESGVLERAQPMSPASLLRTTFESSAYSPSLALKPGACVQYADGSPNSLSCFVYRESAARASWYSTARSSRNFRYRARASAVHWKSQGRRWRQFEVIHQALLVEPYLADSATQRYMVL